MKFFTKQVSIDQGVPLKGASFDFTTSEKIKTVEFDSSELFERTFVLASSTYSDKEILNSPAAKKSFPKIQLLCNVESMEKKEDLYHYTVFPFKYVKAITQQNETELTSFIPFNLKDKYPNNHSLDEVKDLFCFIFKNTQTYNLQIEENILLSESLEELLNCVALHVYVAPIDLYAYQQTDSEKEKFKDILNLLFDSSGIIPVSFDPNEQPIGPTEKDIFSLFVKEVNKQIGAQLAEQEDQPVLDQNAIDNMPPAVKEKYFKESKRLKRLPPSSLEYQTQLDYVELLEEMPWQKYSKYNIDIDEIKTALNSTHKGLEQVKDNILYHFALEKHLKKPNGNVLCFLGPPGTGKTSIVKSIAKATNRKIIKIALGGMNDEAEFRGHRRTYVSAKPGRIVSSIKNSGSMNPIILLDEIDKVTASDKSNPLAALLEILDPEQNSEFIDRFLEIPLDLSKCLFIATANYKKNIPAPLLDRLDIINFKQYTSEEKLEILKDYTIPNLIKDLSLKDFTFEWEDSYYEKIKVFSTREIEKITKLVFKKCIYQNLTEGKTNFKISEDDIYKKSSKKIGFTNGNNS